jgi:prepilin-type processing-associated H-X9-DG protein
MPDRLARQPLDYRTDLAPPPRWTERRGTGLRAAFALLALIVLSLMLLLLLTPPTSLGSEKANRARCNKTLRAIGISIQMYVGDYNGKMPPDIEALLVGMDITPEVFVCHSSTDEPATGPTQEAILQSFRRPGHCSYTLASPLPAKHDAITPSHVLAYELQANHSDGAHVLFGDGHADLVPKAEAERIVAELKAGFNPPRKAE